MKNSIHNAIQPSSPYAIEPNTPPISSEFRPFQRFFNTLLELTGFFTLIIL